MSTSPIDLRHHLRLKDPRLNRRKRHLLLDIVTIAICAVIGNADNWKDIALFGRKRKEWFQRFLELPNGIPSSHTFERVFDRLDPLALQKCLLSWLHEISELLGVRHIAIDGKTLRHSGGGKSPHRQLHLVSAWATEDSLTLGQVAVDEKSNEITAIPRLLALLDVKGALVTIVILAEILAENKQESSSGIHLFQPTHAILERTVLAGDHRRWLRFPREWTRTGLGQDRRPQPLAARELARRRCARITILSSTPPLPAVPASIRRWTARGTLCLWRRRSPVS